MSGKLTEAHSAVDKLVQELKRQGTVPSEIIDALLVASVNMGINFTNRENVATMLEQLAADLRSKRSNARRH